MKIQNKKPNPEASSSAQISSVFFLNGTVSILGWNSVLSSLDYFTSIYAGHNVYLYFPIPVFVAYVVTAILFHSMVKRFSYENLIKFGLLCTNLSLVFLLGITVLFGKNVDLGFYLSMVCCFCLGFFNNIAQLAFYRLINYFGSSTVSRFTMGTGVSGIILIILKAIIMYFFNSQSYKMVPIMIYFSLAIVFNLYDLSRNINLFKSKEYMQINQKIIQKQKQQEVRVSSKEYWQEMRSIYRVVYPYPLLIFFDVLITFTLFPNLVLAKNTSFGPLWTNVIFIFVYNVADFIGKFVADFRKSFNSYSIIYLLFARVFFYYTIPLLVKRFTNADELMNNNYFPFLNLFLFAFSNGFVLNGSFILAYQKCPPRYLKNTGVLCGILLEVGIMVATFVAIPIQALVQPDI